MSLQRLRSETPGCQERIHLNNAGAALMPEPVVRAIQDHITLESRIGGYEAEEARNSAAQAAYSVLGGVPLMTRDFGTISASLAAGVVKFGGSGPSVRIGFDLQPAFLRR